jgi:hypothetical protein
MLTLQIVKFSLLASLFLSVYGAMRLLGFSRIVASASMLGLFLIPQIAWESQRALTHSVAGTAGCGWAFLAFAWHMRARHAGSAAALGAAMAAALLGKFNASFFLIMQIVQAFSFPNIARHSFPSVSLVTLLAFAICFGPTATWMLAHKSSVIARASKFEIGASGNLFFDRLMGMESLVEAAFLFSILALAIAGIIALIHWKKRIAPPTPLTTGEKFLRLLILVGVVIVLAGVVVTGANNVKDRWLQPVLFLTPALMASLMGRYRIGNRALIDYAVVSAVLALIVPPVLSYYLTYGSSSPPYGQLDYRHLYEEVQAKGPFKTDADNAQIPGNFRLFDSSLRVVHPETPDARAHLTPPVLVMWFGGAEPNERMAALLQSANIAVPQNGVATTDIQYKTRPEKHMTVSYFLVP